MRWRIMLAGLAALGLFFGIVGAVNQLPSLAGRAESTALVASVDTAIGRAIGPKVAANPGLSGIHQLKEARNAFAARLLLADGAERSLDVQYYIWRHDTSGDLLFKALGRAA